MKAKNVTLVLAGVLVLGSFVGCSSDTTPPDDGSILCSEDNDCPYGTFCSDGVCRTTSVPCDEADSCPPGSVCRNGACVVEGTDGGIDGDGGDGGEGEQSPKPDIVVLSPPLSGDPPVYQVNFGNVLVGETVGKQIELSNDGDADLQIIQLNFEAGSDADDFSIDEDQLNSLPIVVPPGESTILDVLYTATDGLTDHAVLDIISNDPDEPLVQIHLLSEFKGEAFASVNPTSLEFGDIPVGDSSQPLSFLVSNQGTGNAVLQVEDIRFGIMSNPDFDLQVTDAASQGVVPPVFVNNGEFLQVDVTYHPQLREDDADEVIVVSDDVVHPSLSVAIAGRGVLGDLNVQPSPVDVGKVRVGQHGELIVTLSNSGGAPFSISGVNIADVSQEWTLSSSDLDLADLGNNPKQLAPAESVTVLLGFDPEDVGQELGTLVIDNTTEEPQRQVAMQANGFIPPSVQTTPDPAVLLFGNVQMDFGSGAKEIAQLDVLIKNVGGEDLIISNIQRAGTTSPEYTFEPDQFGSIAPDVELPLRVTFTPMDLGSENGALILDTNDPDIELDGVTGRFKIDLLANGIDPNIFVSPAAAYNFGDVYVGRQALKDISIRNAGTGPLEVTAIDLTAGSSPDFELFNLPALPMVLSNTSIEVIFQVGYTPDLLGPDSGAIQIESSDIGRPDGVTIDLAGNGAGCPAGAIDCDGDPQNGCERPCVPSGVEQCNYIDDDCDCDTDEDFDTQNDPQNCGNCGNVCSYPYGVPACNGGSCELLHCLDGYDDCNGFDLDGCEKNTDTDVQNCGSCDNACQFDHAGASCLAGTCVMGSCNTGYLDCNSSDVDGCEADIFFDELNCSGCGVRCTFANGNGICSGGNCFLDSCIAGYDDCDNQDGNGCEVDLLTDPNNCSFCNNVCPGSVGTPVCNNGSCDVSSCNPGLAECISGDGQPCETNIWADPNNCNGCDIVCSLDHATADCSNGSCIVDTCDSGYGDCDSLDGNGCETELTIDPINCGFCGNVCTYDNAQAGCASSLCFMGACDAGYYNIDNNPGNGCECAEDGFADICDDALITDLGSLASGSSVQITGNLIPAPADEDWFTFSAADNNSSDLVNGFDNYHLHIYFDSVGGNPSNQYVFQVYRNTNVSAQCAQKGNPVCSGEYLEYDHDYYNECSVGTAHQCRSTASGPGACYCVNNTARYWLRVERAGSTVTCAPYLINIDFTQ